MTVKHSLCSARLRGERLLRSNFRLSVASVLLILFGAGAVAQQAPSNPAPAQIQAPSLPNALSWQQVQDRFMASNPTLKAGAIGIDESRAQEITAHLRPNPTFGAQVDQLTLFHNNPYQPLSQAYPNITFNYLHERDHKRELRTDSAKQATKIAVSTQTDLQRTLVYSLRQAFVQTLQAKAVLALTSDDLSYYDHVLDVSRDRFKAGDIAQVDLDRLELGRVQYEQDNETADVNVRTAKIQLLQLMNDRSLRLRRFSRGARPISSDRDLRPARPAGRAADCREGEDRSSPRHRERFDRPDLWLRCRASAESAQ